MTLGQVKTSLLGARALSKNLIWHIGHIPINLVWTHMNHTCSRMVIRDWICVIWDFSTFITNIKTYAHLAKSVVCASEHVFSSTCLCIFQSSTEWVIREVLCHWCARFASVQRFENKPLFVLLQQPLLHTVLHLCLPCLCDWVYGFVWNRCPLLFSDLFPVAASCVVACLKSWCMFFSYPLFFCVIE